MKQQQIIITISETPGKSGHVMSFDYDPPVADDDLTVEDVQNMDRGDLAMRLAAVEIVNHVHSAVAALGSQPLNAPSTIQ